MPASKEPPKFKALAVFTLEQKSALKTAYDQKIKQQQKEIRKKWPALY